MPVPHVGVHTDVLLHVVLQTSGDLQQLSARVHAWWQDPNYNKDADKPAVRVASRGAGTDQHCQLPDGV